MGDRRTDGWVLSKCLFNFAENEHTCSSEKKDVHNSRVFWFSSKKDSKNLTKVWNLGKKFTKDFFVKKMFHGNSL